MDWFRVYSEMVGDAKIRRVSRQLHRSVAEVVGVWIIMLSLASDSPQRGWLLLSEGVAVSLDDLDDMAGTETAEIAGAFLDLGMIDQADGIWRICNWDRRQFASDNVTERTRKHRRNVPPVTQSEQSETFPERSRNVSGTPSDTDTDTETKTDPESPLGAPDGAKMPALAMAETFQGLLTRLRAEKNKPAILREVYTLCFGEAGAPDFGYLGKVAREVGGAGHLAELMWQLVPRPPTGDVLAFILAQHQRNGSTRGAPATTKFQKTSAMLAQVLGSPGGTNGYTTGSGPIIDGAISGLHDA